MSVLLDAAGVAAAVDRLAEALAEAIRADPDRRWALVGVRRGGIPLAERLAAGLVARGLPAPARGVVDITLYRDDLYTGLERPVTGRTVLEFDVDGAGIVLVDDVLFTGRTVRAALGEIHDYGRPAFVRLLVLVDRGHRELPIAADWAGLAVRTDKRARVTVRWAPGDGPEDRVDLEEVGG